MSNSTPKRWVLASHNAGKAAEFEQLLSAANINIQNLSHWTNESCDEPFDTFIENALIKARYASQISGLPALADDSGLCVPSLGGKPGVYSARYAGVEASNAANNQKLLQTLLEQGCTEPHQRLAYYVCVLVLVQHPNDPNPIIAQGLWHGQIALEPMGNAGFGYDPIFWLPEKLSTAAMLTPDEKNKLSHRHQAVARLRDLLAL